jgi:hypothetical protein
MRGAAAGLAALLCLHPGVARADALGKQASTILEGCVAQVSTHLGVDDGRTRFDLAELCPELHALVQASPALREFGGLDGETASLRQLGDMQALVADFSGLTTGRAAPAFDYQGLDGLLDQILVTKEKPSELWERLRRRLLEWLDAIDHDGRVTEWLDRLSGRWAEWLWNAAFLALIVLALVLAAKELRRARPWRLRRARPGTLPAPEPRGMDATGAPSIDTLEGLPPRRQVGVVLEWVIWQLGSRGALPAGPGFTNRELLGYLRGPAEGAFADLVASAERVLYGERQPGPTEVSRLKSLAQRIVHQGTAILPGTPA